MTDAEPLPTMADVLGNDGPLPVIRWREHDWQVAYPTPHSLAPIEEEVVAMAWAALDRVSARMPARHRKATEDALQQAIIGGQHTFGGSVYTSVMNGPDGSLLLLWACLRPGQPDVSVADARQMMTDRAEAVGRVLGRVWPGFIEVQVAKAGGAPDKQREAKELAAAVIRRKLEEAAEEMAARRAELRSSAPSPASPPSSAPTPDS